MNIVATCLFIEDADDALELGIGDSVAFTGRAEYVKMIEMGQGVLHLPPKEIFEQILVFVPGYLARD
jgi:hypothetical protein